MNIAEFEEYIKKKGKKHVIFDFDATICTLLIDWSNWRKEVEKLVLDCKVETDWEEVGSQEIQNLCIKKGGKEARDRLVDIGQRNEKEYYAGFELVPVAPPLIDIAKKYAKLYMWTSNDRQTILPILPELKIDDIFEKIITRNDVNFIKPESDGFSLIYTEGISRSEYLMIGDSKADEGAAKDAGIDFLNIAEFEL